jgi:hypothetical protein
MINVLFFVLTQATVFGRRWDFSCPKLLFCVEYNILASSVPVYCVICIIPDLECVPLEAKMFLSKGKT